MEHVVRPKYPKDALKAGMEGLVEIKVLVGANGKMKDTKAVKGDSALLKAALDGIKKWRFHPVIVGDEFVDTTYRVTVDFRLSLEEAIPRVEIESPKQPVPTFPILALPSGETVYKAGTPGLTPPKGIYTPEPEMPEQARRNRESGAVTLTVVVGNDGKPATVVVACSSNFDFNVNAVQTVRGWKFQPALKDGRPVATQIAVEISYQTYHP